MADKMLNAFDVWISAQGVKSRTRLRSVDNVSLEGIVKLRELIIQLAVSGKLTQQDPNDEPASALWNRIKREKLRLKESGVNQKNPVEVNKTRRTFDLPKSWYWCRLEDMFYPISVGKSKIKTSEIKDEGIIPVIDQGQSYISGYTNDENLKIEIPGPVIIFGDHTTAVKYIDFDFVAGADGVKILRPILSYERYFYLVIKSLPIESRGYGRHYGRLIDNLYPLAPLAEQHRIVAKVDELMALCDTLQQQEMYHLKSHALLVETLLGTLTRAADANEFQQAWNKLYEHFDDLFTTEDSIDQLKQTILQLAVMGKLVPQDPNDEPASELLKRIAKEKERLVEEGEIKKQKQLPEVKDEAILFSLPDKWVWSKLGDFGILLGGFAYQSSDFKSSGDHQVIRMGNIRPNFLRLEESPAFISDKLAKETIESKIQIDDVLVTMTGTKGKRDYLYTLVITAEHLNQRELYLNQRLCIIRPIWISSSYINLVAKDKRLLDAMYAQSTGTANQANIGMGTLNNWVLPIPPLNEQKRIVSKVDELFALCDRLKERIAEAQKVANQMAEAVVE